MLAMCNSSGSLNSTSAISCSTKPVKMHIAFVKTLVRSDLVASLAVENIKLQQEWFIAQQWLGCAWLSTKCI